MAWRWVARATLVVAAGALVVLSVRAPAPLASHRAAAPVAPHRSAVPLASHRAASRLSAQQLAGQRIIYAYAGRVPPPSLLAAIRAGEAGGVIFFGPNIAGAAQMRGVVAELQRAALASPVHTPLLLLVDQEGGEVRRLPGAPALSERQIGESANGVALARSAGAGAAATLAASHVNANLAPVLDVYRHPGNFIDEFQRAYSSRSATVARLGAAFIAAQQGHNIAATAKHFPGLGAAAQSQNTDLRPVTLQIPLATLRAVDEAPYRTAIAAGVKLVMTSWAVYPALDPHRPAGLSAAVIGGELRRRLGFHGVTITDGIDAGAVTPYGSLGRRAVLAAAAGADLILCAATVPSANTPTIGIAARNALAGALTHHTVTAGSMQAAVQRILALRAHP